MSDEKSDTPARKPVTFEITEGVVLRLGGHQSAPRRGKHSSLLDEVWEKILRHDPRFSAGIPPESEMPNREFYKIARAACAQLGMKPPPDRAIKAWRRKRS
jgi:hypothetical protein